MKRCISLVLHAAMTCMLTGCQYVSYWKTNTTTAPMHSRYSAEANCAAMGAYENYASMDWCVRREELARGHNEFGF